MTGSCRVLSIKKRRTPVPEKKSTMEPTLIMAREAGVSTHRWLSAALEAGYLAQTPTENGYRYVISGKGKQRGVRSARSRIGTYYLWPSDIDIIPASGEWQLSS